MKKKYLDFVMMTEEEHAKLVAKFGVSEANERIEDLNVYLGSRGKRYASHYFTVLNWARMDSKRQRRKKVTLFPIIGKVCGKRGCCLPAVYKSSGEYDHYWCTVHMPDNVKELYE